MPENNTEDMKADTALVITVSKTTLAILNLILY